MGKAAAAGLLFVIVVLIVWTGAAVAVKSIQAARWQRALQRAKWVPHTEMVGPHEAEVSVRRVARLGRRQEILNEFAPVTVHIEHPGDPRLFEALTLAAEQASINNAVNLGED